MTRSFANGYRAPHAAGQRGVALAILLWFIAAMSLLVAGIVAQARVEIKLAQLHANRARVEAAADGAIHMALAELMWREFQGEILGPGNYLSLQQLGGMNVAVNFTPLQGLIDINQAPEGLLLLLFSAVPDIEPDQAQELAFNVVEWRTAGMGLNESGDDASGQAIEENIRHGRFEAVEDLLLVPGLDRQTYVAVKESVYVSTKGLVGVDWASAPASVLRVLGDMDDGEILDLMQSRMNAGELLAAPSSLSLEFQEESVLPSYRVDALVTSDDVTYRRRRWVDRSRAGVDGLPWSFFRTEAVTVEAGLEVEIMAMLEDDDVGI